MSKQQRLAVVVFVVGLSLTIGGTASASSLAGSSWSGFKKGSIWAFSSSGPAWSKPWVKPQAAHNHFPIVISVKFKGTPGNTLRTWKPRKFAKFLEETPPDQPKPMQPIPEPAAALAYGAGLLLIARGARRRR